MLDEGLRICGARKRKSNDICHSTVVMANGRCRLHGGSTPVGVMSANFKTGKYSKDAPTRLLAAYECARHDAQLLENREELALMDARIQDLLKRVDSGESRQAWEKAQKAFRTYQAALDRSEGTEAKLALHKLQEILLYGLGDTAAWNDLNAQIALRMKLAESERRRLVELSQTITVEKALLLVAQLAGVVKQNVKDPQERAAIARELRAITDDD